MYWATFVLEPGGRLRLDHFQYMLKPGLFQQESVEEIVAGNFWMVMKPHFNAPRTYIPFNHGVIVENEREWVTEDSS
jgi:hypothetical protein